MFKTLTGEDFHKEYDNIIYEQNQSFVLVFVNDEYLSDELVKLLSLISNKVIIPICVVNANEYEDLADEYCVYNSNIPVIIIFEDGDCSERFDNESNFNDIINTIQCL